MRSWRPALVVAATMLAPASAVAEGATPPPRLSGTVVAGSVRVAILAAPGLDTPVREGDQFGPFTVHRVGPGRVELDGPDGRLLLTPEPSRQPARPASVLSSVIPTPSDPISDK